MIKKTKKKHSTKTHNKSHHKSHHKTQNTNPNPNANINETIINTLTIVKNYYKKLNNTIHVNAYERAIYQISKWKDVITNGNELKGLQGIGKGMIEKIDIILKTGTLPIIKEKKLLSMKNANSENANTMSTKTLDILGFSDKYIKELEKTWKLNIDESDIGINIDTINKIRELSNTGKIKLTHMQEIGLKYYEDLTSLIPRNEITKIGDILTDHITEYAHAHEHKHNDYYLNVFLSGSYPSGLKKESKDIDLLIVDNSKSISGNSLQNIIKYISKDINIETLAVGKTKFLGLIKSPESNKWRHLDIRYVNRSAFPYTWLYFSSGKVFNKFFREILKRKGYKLNEWGLYKDSKAISFPDTKIETKINIINEELLEYAENIIKQIYNIADMEYKNIKDRY